MNKSYSLFLSILGVVFGFFILSFSYVKGAGVTINSFDINPKKVNADQRATLNYSFRITSTKEDIKRECGQSGSLRWEIQRSARVSPKVLVGARIGADVFLSGPVNKSGTFPFAASGTSETLQLKVGCFGSSREESTSSISKILGSSTPVLINIIGHEKGIVDLKFDANPGTVTPGSQVQMNFKLAITSKQADIDNTCRDKQVVWRVYMFPADKPDTFENPIKSGAIRSQDFGTGKTINQDFSQTITALNKDFIFKARATCDVALRTDQLAVSSAVLIKSGGAGPGGEPPKPKPGETSTTTFEIRNPIAADNFVDLIKIIGQWIFNLAIPIAVIMILYAGFLWLTAGARPANVAKAKTVFWYTILGLIIIFIGSGFLSLIKSILNLGN